MPFLRLRPLLAFALALAACKPSGTEGGDGSVSPDASAMTDAGTDGGSPWGGDSSVGFDASSGDAGLVVFPPTFESPSADVTLVPGEALEVVAVVRDPGGNPVPSSRVDVALLGTQLDSAVSDLILFSGPDGRVRFFVFAGQLETSFQLRISTAPFVDAYLRVTVADGTRASVALTVDPAEVALLSQVDVFAFANATCAEVSLLPPTAFTTFGPTETGSLSLQTSRTFAVLAVGADASGGAPHEVCVDAVDPNTTTALEFDFGLAGP